MVITYHGGQCFKVSQGDLTLAFDPPSKDSSIKVSKFGADIVLSSLNHSDFNGVETASIGEKTPFAITGPGEYDVKGVVVHGFGSKGTDTKKGISTVYSVSFEGMKLCFLGALEADIPQAAKQELDDIDILFVPIGGGEVLDYSTAYKLAVQLEAKIVIPMHYTPESLKHFLKEAGEQVAPIDKLTLKKKDLEGKEGEIVVLSSN